MKIHDGVIHAPDFKGIEHWINTKPLTMKDLRGKVVLIDFWTYSCINCIRTLPYLKQLYTSYKDQGFVLVGVHAPEFAFEKVVSNVEDAVRRFDITYPVAMDNAYQTWLAYDNHYWPAHYLIDQNGIIRYTHFGEGEYTTTENKIRQLLGLAPLPADGEREIYKSLTPEMYLGYERAHSYQTGITIQPGKTKHYEYTGQLGIDEVGITGSWFVDSQFIKSAHDDAQLLLNFVANRVYLVMQSADQKNIKVLLDGKPLPSIYYTKDINDQGEMSVHKARMYDIIDLKGDYGRHILTLQVPEGVSLYAFTFGGSADELTNK